MLVEIYNKVKAKVKNKRFRILSNGLGTLNRLTTGVSKKSQFSKSLKSIFSYYYPFFNQEKRALFLENPQPSTSGRWLIKNGRFLGNPVPVIRISGRHLSIQAEPR